MKDSLKIETIIPRKVELQKLKLPNIAARSATQKKPKML
jgi:hypothetical protein